MDNQMRSSVIATAINYSNTALIIAAATFAAFGVVAILSKKLRWRLPFLSALGVAAIAAFALEATAFNFLHYLKYFAGPATSVVGPSKENPRLLRTTDGTPAEIHESGVLFDGLNRSVASVYIDIEFGGAETRDAKITWVDEGMTQSYVRRLYKYLPHENYVPIQPCGKVSKLDISFAVREGNTSTVSLKDVTINKPIPYYFSGLRLLVVSAVIFAVIALINKTLRAKAAYYLFEYKFDPTNRKQNIVYACTVALVLLFSWVCAYTSVDETTQPINMTPSNLQYSRYLIDALINGRVNIDFGHPEKLLNAERPYDINWLTSNGYEMYVDWAPDIAYYNGKYYVYYGAVPAVLLLLPYKLITGNYMSYHAGVFVFASIAVVFMALLWRLLVKKYMPTARFAFYLLSFLTLFSVSHLFAPLGDPSVWLIVQVAGFTFAVAGTFLLLRSVDKENINHLQLFFACLCFALAVGCRPNMVSVSILVPAVLWKRRSWKSAMLVLIPYSMVAIPLCAYNYIRFDSIFEFGQKYCTSRLVTLYSLNPLGKIHRMFITFIHYLFRPYIYSLHFPFVEFVPPRNRVTTIFGFVWGKAGGGGLINFPILFCLSYLLKILLSKEKPNGFHISLIFSVVGLTMLVLYSILGIFHARYLLDCMIFFMLPSLFCAYHWGAYNPRFRYKVVYGLLAASILVGMFLFVSGSDSSWWQVRCPVLYRYLEYSLGIIERV